MKSNEFFIAGLAVLFAIIVSIAVTTLSLNAGTPTTTTTTAIVRWATVCCGSICPGGEDICHGNYIHLLQIKHASNLLLSQSYKGRDS